MRNIYIGNLDLSVTEERLRTLFAPFGAVETVTIVKDRDTSLPRGFAFVEMTQTAEAQSAISALDGTLLHERALRVNEARTKFHRNPGREPGSREHRRHHI